VGSNTTRTSFPATDGCASKDGCAFEHICGATSTPRFDAALASLRGILVDDLLMDIQGTSSLPKLIVFGGNGFVGSRVCEEALRTGLGVVSINRSGPPKLSSPWIKDVEWVRVRGPSFKPNRPLKQQAHACLEHHCSGTS
jgi:hypothetical protein